jgi:hypothetical protein
MSEYGKARLTARKTLMRNYQNMGMNRADARAVAYTPMSDKGMAAWRNFIGRSASSDASVMHSGTSQTDDIMQPGA